MLEHFQGLVLGSIGRPQRHVRRQIDFVLGADRMKDPESYKNPEKRALRREDKSLTLNEGFITAFGGVPQCLLGILPTSISTARSAPATCTAEAKLF